MRRYLFVKLTLALALTLVIWQLGIPWIAEQVYLRQQHSIPELVGLRINPENAACVKLLENWHAGEVLPLNFTLEEIYWEAPDEGRLLAWKDDFLVLASFPDGQYLYTWKAEPPSEGATWVAQFSLDGKFIAARYGNRVRVFDVQTGETIGPWMYCSERFALSSNSAHLACAGTLGLSEDPSRVVIFNPRDGSLEALFKTRAFSWKDLLYSPDGKLLVAFGDDRKRIYAWIGHTRVFQWLGLTGYRIAFTPDGLALATGRSIVTMNQRRNIPLVYDPPEQAAVEVAFSPSGDLLVTQAIGGDLYIMRVADGVQLASFRLPEGIAQINFSPDGAWFTVLLNGAVYRYGLRP